MVQPPLSTSEDTNARCALHDERAASIICTRCGSYACDLCRKEGTDGVDYCSRCSSRVPVLADRSTRFVANLVDSLVLIVPWFIVAILQVVMSGPGGTGSSTKALIMLMGAVATLGVCGFQLYLAAQNGQSIGKRMMGIRVVRTDGSPVDLLRLVFARNTLPVLLSFACGPFGLVDALFIFTEDRRCIHDRIAGTKVVKL